MKEDDISEIARLMLKQYGDQAAALMATRSRNCARHGELASAAFWHNVGEEVSKLAGTVEAVKIRREALRKTTGLSLV